MITREPVRTYAYEYMHDDKKLIKYYRLFHKKIEGRTLLNIILQPFF